MNTYKEPIPLFKEGDTVMHAGKLATILKISTYCTCCDRFLAEAKYALILEDQQCFHRISENLLSFPEGDEP